MRGDGLVDLDEDAHSSAVLSFFLMENNSSSKRLHHQPRYRPLLFNPPPLDLLTLRVDGDSVLLLPLPLRGMMGEVTRTMFTLAAIDVLLGSQEGALIFLIHLLANTTETLLANRLVMHHHQYQCFHNHPRRVFCTMDRPVHLLHQQRHYLPSYLLPQCQ